MTRIPEIKEGFLELAGVMDLRAFVSGWFHDAPFEVRGMAGTAQQVGPAALTGG